MSICRTCLRHGSPSSGEFVQINTSFYFSLNGVTIREILNSCTSLDIDIDDGLPQSICSDCVKDLEVVYVFIQKVLKSHEELNKCRIAKKEAGSEEYSFKDPLESVIDNTEEETNDENVAYTDRNSICSSTPYINNDDKRFVENVVPLITSSHSESDNDDNDFLISVESQIFPQGQFKCKLCEKTYFTSKGLQAHLEIHAPKTKSKHSTRLSLRNKKRKNIKKINCEYSDKEEGDVVLDNNVLVSKKRQNGNQPKPKKMFPCQVCGKQMISASKLRYHMVMHTGEKDYLCTICPKAYSTIYALKHHMRAHTGERPYECKFCGDRFLRPTTLKSHMRRHTGERPYGCDICGKRFIQHSSMATHIKLNHQDKTIACPYCDKKYARQTDLNTHLLSHSGDKPFACKLCPSRFTRQSNLNKHMNQQHNPINGDATTDNRIKPSFTIESQYHNEEYILPYTSNNKSSVKKITYPTPLIQQNPSTSI